MSAIFGRDVYRVVDLANERRDAAWASTLDSRKPLFAYARVDVADVARMQSLCDDGFRVVDVTVKYARTPAWVQQTENGVAIRSAAPADYDRVTDIAGTAFRYSRFHVDPR